MQTRRERNSSLAENNTHTQNMKIYKRRTLFIAFVAMFILSVQSQNLSYGVILGADITNIYLKPVPFSAYKEMYSPILSYNFNGFISYKSDFFLGVSIEPGFIRKGGVQLFDYLNSQSEPENHKVIFTNSSLQLPVLLDFHLNDRLYISAGAELEYRVSQKAVLTDETTTNHVFAGSFPLYVNVIPNDNYPSVYYSGLVGLQYKINKRFDVGLRYGFSLKELYRVC